MSKKRRAKSFILLAVIYILAAAVGFLTFIVLPYDMWLNLLIADLIATAIVFIFSMLFDNSSLFDPFWATSPLVILTAFCTGHEISWLNFLIMLALAMWSIRYLVNWVYAFRDIRRESDEYQIIHDAVREGYPLVSLFCIHLVPSAITFACILPAILVVEREGKLNVGYVAALLVVIVALVLQGIADYQSRKFVHDGEQGFLKSGLWKKSRHPSFVVEVFVWWGFAVAAIFSLGFSWDLILGAIFSTVYLLGMRALLEDRVFAKKEGFEQYKKDVAIYYAPFTPKRKPEEKEEPVEEVVVLADGFDDSEIEEAMAAPAVVLADIDYDKNDLGAIVVGVGDGVEVVGVVWPEKRRRHKVYKYDPNGESLKEGDIVLVPSRDVAKNRDIIRKATVVYENYHIESDKLNKPLKKIIAVVKNTSK